LEATHAFGTHPDKRTTALAFEMRVVRTSNAEQSLLVTGTKNYIALPFAPPSPLRSPQELAGPEIEHQRRVKRGGETRNGILRIVARLAASISSRW